MPGLTHSSLPEDKIGILDNIVSTYLTKDIKALIQEENVRAFNSLLYLLAQNQGSMVSHSSLARETGLSEPTVLRHLEIMAQTYVCFPVTSFSQNLANELKKSKKYYLFDLGIRNGLLKDFRLPEAREDKGALYESFVLLQIVQQLKPNMEVRFWRTKKGDEVDFILIKNRVPVPVEVKSGLTDFSIPKGMRLFMKNYPKAPFGIVFSEELSGEAMADNRPVYFKPLSAASEIEYLQKLV
jgi:predicted AAA+ superfamily ATPase